MSKVDLHIHSTASDGKYPPQEVVRKAAEAGLTTIALTDHDTVDGIAAALTAAKSFPGLRVIPGVEVSTDVEDGEIHVLGFFMDYTDPDLSATLAHFRASRETRAKKIVAKLASLGISIDWERVQQLAGDGTIGRPHIAQAMLEQGYITSLREAFNKYIGRTGPAYVEREKMTPPEAVKLILKARGLPVLAHPFSTKNPEHWVARLKRAGLCGLEAYYADHTPEDTEHLLQLAAKYALVVTGGSDFHGLESGIGAPLGGVEVPEEAANRLIALAEKRGLKTYG